MFKLGASRVCDPVCCPTWANEDVEGSAWRAAREHDEWAGGWGSRFAPSVWSGEGAPSDCLAAETMWWWHCGG